MRFTLQIDLPDDWTKLDNHELAALVTNVAARLYDGSLGGDVRAWSGTSVGRFDVQSELELEVNARLADDGINAMSKAFALDAVRAERRAVVAIAQGIAEKRRAFGGDPHAAFEVVAALKARGL